MIPTPKVRKRIRRNATRMIADLKQTHTVGVVFSLQNDFHPAPLVDLDFAWNKLNDSHHADAFHETNGTVTISLHSNCWYVLSQPEAEQQSVHGPATASVAGPGRNVLAVHVIDYVGI